MPRVLILGAGFGGIATAIALRRGLAADDEIVLVDRREAFVMGLRKTWFILGISPLAYGERHLARLAEQGIRFERGEITRIDPAAHAVEVNGRSVEADALVVALGASHDMTAVPGLADHGHSAWTLEGLEHAHAAIDAFRGGRVAIGIFGQPYSCPPAPYELALLLDDRFVERGIDAEITVFSPAAITLPIVGAAGCMPLDGRLAERGIGFLPARVATAVGPDAVSFADGEPLAYDLLLAIPPHRLPTVLADAGLPRANGWLTVDRETLETGVPGTYAIGDCTFIGLSNGMPMPKAGLFAQRQGEVVAARIAARLRGEEPETRFAGAGSCFLEMGGGEASMISGDFYADPPRAELTEPTVAQRIEKERFESERLTDWFGG
jgi:sulfide:quinone oxidoreductase